MNNRRIVVLGGGESGFGSAVLAKVKGFDVFLSDFGTIPEKYAKQLTEWDIPFEQGGHTAELILNADEVIKSPGISDKVPIMKVIHEKNIPVISEIEFAGRYNSAKTICITGSNGKTTTTTLIYEILKQGGFNVALAGNIGVSFAYQVATCNFDWYVIELSSFQLDGMYDFRADVAVLMNITPDHLDRYNYVMQNYVDSKFRIIQNQKEGDVFVYCADDNVIEENLGKYNLKHSLCPFSVKQQQLKGAYLNGEVIKCDNFEININELQIKGIHNIYNVMAAIISTLSIGINRDKLRSTLRDFAGVEHRLEKVATMNGVLYLNDSKATNVDSVWYALESMTTPVVWIAGGTDKGNDYEPLDNFVKEKVKALVCMGVDNKKLIDKYTGVVPIFDTHSLEDALNAARSVAVSGDTVLLSPACASFDLFKNYEDRGRQFKDFVNKINNGS